MAGTVLPTAVAALSEAARAKLVERQRVEAAVPLGPTVKLATAVRTAVVRAGTILRPP